MFIKKKVLHHDGKTIVIARGLIGQDNVFNGEYRFEGFTWGVEIPLAVVKPTYVDVAQKQLLADANLNLKKIVKR